MNDAPTPDAGDPLDLVHALAPGRLVLSRGNLFAVLTSRGDVMPPGARELGLFHEDTRHLSEYELRVPGTLTLLSSGVEAAVLSQVDLTTTDEEVGGLLDEPVQFLHVRRRHVLDTVFTEHVVFTNHLNRPVTFDVEWRFASDWADVFEVRGARRARRGHALPAENDASGSVLRYRDVTGAELRTDVRFDPPPGRIEDGRAYVRIELAPGASVEQRVTVACAIKPRAAEPRMPKPGRASRPDAAADRVEPFETRVARARAEAEAFRAGCARVRCRDAHVEQTFERAMTDVFALRILHRGRWIVGAGIPWFAAPFGRDALLTSLQLLPFAPRLAEETLRFLAAWQGTVTHADREEEPGRIFHELRRGEMARAGEIPHAPYFGSIDATPLFLILAAEHLRWTNNLLFAREIWPHVVAAAEWLDRRTQDGRAFLSYQRATPLGLENQGWKDSRDGVPFPDGTRAATPIALVEVQGYAASAWLGAAEIAAALGDVDRAARWAARVDPFARRLDEAFWDASRAFYGLARDGNDVLVPTLTSNPGHLLWCRAVPEGRARRVVEVLTSPEMDAGWGIRTLARGQPAYNPLSYHNGSVWPHDNGIVALGMARYGFGRAARRVADSLLAASEHFSDHRLPELFCGLSREDGELLVHYPVSCSPQAWASGALFMLLQACLGLEADAPRGRLRVRNPTLPTSIRRLEVVGLRVGRATAHLRFARSGHRTHCDVLDLVGGPLKVDIEVE